MLFKKIGGAESLGCPRDALPLSDGRLLVADAATGKLLAFGGAAATPKVLAAKMRQPHAAVADGEVLYVADREAHCVLVLSTSTGEQCGVFHGNASIVKPWGRFDGEPPPQVEQLGAATNGPARAPVLSFPRSLALDDGLLYVLCEGSNEVVALDLSLGGAPVERFGSGSLSVERSLDVRLKGELAPADALSWPKGIAAHGGEIFVADTANHCVKVYSRRGRLLRQWGHHGSGRGRFKYPTGIAVHGNRVVVCEQVGRRVQTFSLEGSFVADVTVPGAGDLMAISLDERYAYAVDDDGQCVWRLERSVLKY